MLSPYTINWVDYSIPWKYIILGFCRVIFARLKWRSTPEFHNLGWEGRCSVFSKIATYWVYCLNQCKEAIYGSIYICTCEMYWKMKGEILRESEHSKNWFSHYFLSNKLKNVQICRLTAVYFQGTLEQNLPEADPGNCVQDHIHINRCVFNWLGRNYLIMIFS